MFSTVQVVAVDGSKSNPDVSIMLSLNFNQVVEFIEKEMNTNASGDILHAATAICYKLQKSLVKYKSLNDHLIDCDAIIGKYFDCKKLNHSLLFEILSKAAIIMDNEEIKTTGIIDYINTEAHYIDINIVEIENLNQFKTTLKTVLTLIDSDIEFKFENFDFCYIVLRLKHQTKPKTYVKVYEKHFIYSENSSNGYFTATLPYGKISLIPELFR